MINAQKSVDGHLESQLDLVYFGLFDNCNVKCNMCDCWELPRSSRDLDHYLRVMDDILSLRPKAIRITGGEPLLLPALPQLVAYAAAAGVRVSVISNGRTLRGRVKALADAGCAEVVLSVDAPGPVHDTIRGLPGLFSKVELALAEVRNSPMAYGINTVVQRLNIGQIDRLADFLMAGGSSPLWWHLIPVRGTRLLLPDTAQIKSLREVLPSIADRLTEAGSKLVADPDMFDEQPAVACSVPEFTAYVRADTGQVAGCNMLTYGEPPIGNMLQQELDHVWNDRPARDLRLACATAANPGCARCDPASRSMNHVLRDLAIKPRQETGRA